jgi:hypothetical protein
MAMPDGESFWGNNFTAAFTNGSVPMSRLNDMATRYGQEVYSSSEKRLPLIESSLPGIKWARIVHLTQRLE